jgi:chromosomal replication initiation ATPase DnaA
MTRLARQEPHQFEAWFAKLGFQGLSQGTLTLTCESIFAQRYIEAHLTRPLIRTVEEELGPIERIAFVRD